MNVQILMKAAVIVPFVFVVIVNGTVGDVQCRMGGFLCEAKESMDHRFFQYCRRAPRSISIQTGTCECDIILLHSNSLTNNTSTRHLSQMFFLKHTPYIK